jgi:cell division protein FtsQ
MRDLKAPKAGKSGRVRGNRRKKQPRDWQKIFHQCLRTLVCLVSLVLIVAGGGILAQLLFDSSFFKVDTVRVENQVRVSEEEIVALSDVAMGSNIFELDLELIGRKIEENPWIFSARVQRLFPRTVVIRVEERSPKAVINLDYLYYVDGRGDIFKVLEVRDSLDYPVLTGLERQDLLERPDESHRHLQAMMDLVEELSRRSIFSLTDVSEIHLDKLNEIVLYTRNGGVPLRMGAGDYRGKLDRLEKIYADLKPRLRALKYIDLNVMDRIIVKMETGITRKG